MEESSALEGGNAMSATAKISSETPLSPQIKRDPTHAAPTSEERLTDFLIGLERQMKELWSQYVACLDKNGLDETAKALREKYFNLYRCYRHNRNWKNAINNN